MSISWKRSLRWRAALWFYNVLFSFVVMACVALVHDSVTFCQIIVNTLQWLEYSTNVRSISTQYLPIQSCGSFGWDIDGLYWEVCISKRGQWWQWLCPIGGTLGVFSAWHYIKKLLNTFGWQIDNLKPLRKAERTGKRRHRDYNYWNGSHNIIL